jgi:energy-coupling factor transport system ATP-binding protein
MIKLDSVTFSYSSSDSAILKRVNLEIDKGELVLIAGPTGSGKSTLLKVINLLAPKFTGGNFSGSISIDGRDITKLQPHEIAELVGYVGQNPADSFVTETVREELAYGMEQLGLATDFMRVRVVESAKLVGIEHLLDSRLEEISGGEQQRVAIGAALAAGQKILLLDEPTSALDADITKRTVQLLQKLASENKITILLTEHRVERVMELVDSIVLVHRDGSVTKSSAETAFNDPRMELPVVSLSRKLNWTPVATTISKAQNYWSSTADKYVIRHHANHTSRVASGTSKTVAIVKDVSVSFMNASAVSNLSFTLQCGQITALMGRNGSGKSSTLWALQGSGLGKDASVAGQIRIEGKDPAKLSNQDRINLVAMVPQKASDLLFLNSLSKELAESDAFSQVEPGTTSSIFANLVGRVDPGIHPRDLSNGQQIALVLASQLTKNAPLVLLDEPTRGLDYTAKQELAKSLQKLKQDGKAILLASHDVEFLAALCDQVLVLKKGQLIASGTPAEIFLPGTEFATQVADITNTPGVIGIDQIEVKRES